MAGFPYFSWLRSALWVLAIAFFTWLMARIVWQYHSGRTDIDFLLSKQHIIHLTHYKAAFYLHIFPALLVLAAGMTQFSANLLRYRPSVHRWIGRLYAGSILLVCGPAGFVMAWYSNGSWLTHASFVTLSLIWWYCTFQGWKTIRRGDRNGHRNWMIRSYGLTFSAITLRLMQFWLVAMAHFDTDTAYELVAWPSWLINLAIAELLISKKAIAAPGISA